MMEVFAGFLEHTDHHIGRLLDFLDAIGELDNTLIMVISDNGASAEGGPTGTTNENQFFNNAPESLEENLAALDDLGGPKYFNHYAWGWTWAGNTPFRRWKRETYRGGVTDPFIVHWPKGIKARGEVRTQYAHTIDMVPTVLDALGVEPPTSIRGVTQSPIEGVSFAHTFDDAAAPSKHVTQYFEMFGHRSLYHDGWRAVCPWPGHSFAEGHAVRHAAHRRRPEATSTPAAGSSTTSTRTSSECHDVAADNRDRLIEMISLWYAEAGKYNVLPLDGRGTLRLRRRSARSSPRTAQPLRLLPGHPVGPGRRRRRASSTGRTASRPTSRSPTAAPRACCCRRAASTAGSPSTSRTAAALPYNYVAADYFRVVLDGAGARPARHELRFEFEPTGPPDIAERQGHAGPRQLYVEREARGQTELPYTIPLALGLAAGVCVGRDEGSPVRDDYAAPFEFTGTIHRVTVDVSGDLIVDDEAEMKAIMARQ